MIKNLLHGAAIVVLSLSYPCSARNVEEIKVRLRCVSDASLTQRAETGGERISEIYIEVQKINWNEDSSKPPLWGSVNKVEVTVNGNKQTGSLLMNLRDRAAFSLTNESVAQIYEMDLSGMVFKRTTIALFRVNGSDFNVATGRCQKI